MDFYFIEPNGPQLRLPVNPAEINIRQEKLYETINIIELGEVDFCSGGKKISEISFASFFPAEYDSGYCNYPDFPRPTEAFKQLTAWTDGNIPVRLLITEIDVNLMVIITAQSGTVRGGAIGDIYYEITCRSWREVKVTSTEQSASLIRTDTKPAPKIYIVHQGDCLWKIAKRELGNSSRWKDIYAINQKTIGPDPDLILPGQRLVMPT